MTTPARSQSPPSGGLGTERFLQHFLLLHEPFSLTPDPDFLYLSDRHVEALSAVELGVVERRGLTVLTGEVGTGKTSLAFWVLDQWRNSAEIAYLSTGTFTFDDILRRTMAEFGLITGGSVGADLDLLGRFLRRASDSGRTVVLMIDEAQNIPDPTFEQLRLLLNFETAKNKLIQIVLIGQQELSDRLRQENLRHVAERVGVRTELAPLSPEECVKYVEHRLTVAGAPIADVFAPGAVEVIVKASAGIPRRLNVLCHNAMLFAYGAEQERVDRQIAKRTVEHAYGGSRLPSQRVTTWAVAAGLLLTTGLAVATGIRVAANRDAEAARLPAAVGEVLDQDDRSASAPAEPPVAVETDETSPAAADESAGPSSETAVTDPPQTAPIAQPSETQSPSRSREETTTAVLQDGENLSQLIFDHYGFYDDSLLRAVLRANPWIGDVTRVNAGSVVTLPARPASAEQSGTDSSLDQAAGESSS